MALAIVRRLDFDPDLRMMSVVVLELAMWGSEDPPRFCLLTKGAPERCQQPTMRWLAVHSLSALRVASLTCYEMLALQPVGPMRAKQHPSGSGGEAAGRGP